MSILGGILGTDAIAAQFATLLAKVTAMSTQLDALTANVTTLTTAVDGLITLATSTKTALDAAIAAGNDGAQLQALSDNLAAEIAKVNATVAAITPAPAPTA